MTKSVRSPRLSPFRPTASNRSFWIDSVLGHVTPMHCSIFIIVVEILFFLHFSNSSTNAQSSYGIPLIHNTNDGSASATLFSSIQANDAAPTSSSSSSQPTRRPSLFYGRGDSSYDAAPALPATYFSSSSINPNTLVTIYPTSNTNRQAKSLIPDNANENSEFYSKNSYVMASSSNNVQSSMVSPSTSSATIKCLRRLVGYYTWWSSTPLQLWQARLLTHINYAFLYLLPNGTLSLEPETIVNNAYSASLAEDGRQTRQRLQSLLAVRRQLLQESPASSPQMQLKLLFSIGGWSGSQYFSRVAASRDLTENFVTSAIQLLVKYDFDGLDLDWEFPVTGGAADVESSPKDLENFITLCARLRAALNEASLVRPQQTTNAINNNYVNNYLLTIASAGAKYNLDAGYDLTRLAQFVDWFNVMAYDYYGAWDSPYGALTGPVAPLFFSAPRTGAGGATATNYTQDKCVDYTVKYYVCHLQQPSSAPPAAAAADNSWMLDKIVLGVPFYGRYWNNAGQWPVERGNDMWRIAEPSVSGTNRTARIAGGVLSFNEIKSKWIVPSNTPGGAVMQADQIVQKFDEQTRTPFIWNPTTRVLLTYENEQSVWEKTKYVIEHGLGGVMFWSLDLDIGGNSAYASGQSLLENIIQAGLCTAARGPASGVPIKYFDCGDVIPNQFILGGGVKIRRWWSYDLDPKRAGMCGKSAPLLDGFYPICNPNDHDYNCCSAFGFCGSGPAACNCIGCVNYGRSQQSVVALDGGANAARQITEPERPSVFPIRWHTLDAPIPTGQPRCGMKAPRIMVDGGVSSFVAICNPDDPNAHCCSSAGYCGTGSDYCACSDCVDYAAAIQPAVRGGGYLLPPANYSTTQSPIYFNSGLQNAPQPLPPLDSNYFKSNPSYQPGYMPQPGTFPAIVTIAPNDQLLQTTTPSPFWVNSHIGRRQATVVEYPDLTPGQRPDTQFLRRNANNDDKSAAADVWQQRYWSVFMGAVTLPILLQLPRST